MTRYEVVPVPTYESAEEIMKRMSVGAVLPLTPAHKRQAATAFLSTDTLTGFVVCPNGTFLAGFVGDPKKFETLKAAAETVRQSMRSN